MYYLLDYTEKMLCVAAFGLIRRVVMYFQMLQFEKDFAFSVRTIWLIAVAGYMGLVAYQAYALEKKFHTITFTVARHT